MYCWHYANNAIISLIVYGSYVVMVGNDWHFNRFFDIVLLPASLFSKKQMHPEKWWTKLSLGDWQTPSERYLLFHVLMAHSFTSALSSPLIQNSRLSLYRVCRRCNLHFCKFRQRGKTRLARRAQHNNDVPVFSILASLGKELWMTLTWLLWYAWLLADVLIPTFKSKSKIQTENEEKTQK